MMKLWLGELFSSRHCFLKRMEQGVFGFLKTLFLQLRTPIRSFLHSCMISGAGFGAGLVNRW